MGVRFGVEDDEKDDGGLDGRGEEKGGKGEVVVVGKDDDEGTKETDKVPENRTTETASATGSTAVRGLG